MKSKLLFITILMMTVISHSYYYNPKSTNDIQTNGTLPLKQSHPITKAISLDVTTVYSGEDIYIDFSNTTLLYISSTYQYNSINNITHNISIQIEEPTGDIVHVKAPDTWNFSSIVPSETVNHNITCNDYDFTPSQAPGSYLYNLTFFSGTTYGRLTTRQNQYLTIDEINDDIGVDGSFDSSFAGNFIPSNNITSLTIQNETVYSGNGSMCIIEASENDILFSQIGYEPPGVENQEEWIEIYNNGISPVNIGDWTISDNSLVYTIPLGTVIDPKKYIVFAKSTAGFNGLFGFNPEFGDLSLTLDNGGDELILGHCNTTEIDYVSWEGFNATWNILAASNNTITRNISISDSGTDSDWLNDTTARPNIGGLNGDVTTGLTPALNLDDGSYYISFVYLFETFTNGTVKFQWFDGESKEHVLNISCTYWEPVFLLIHINGNTTWKNMLLNFTTSGDFVFYIDEFKLWRTNSLIIPTDTIHQYNISSSLISWDSRQNFGVNNEILNHRLLLRNTQSIINSTSLTTDLNGFSSYIYTNSSLDESELELRTWNLNSGFGIDRGWLDDFIDVDNWSVVADILPEVISLINNSVIKIDIFDDNGANQIIFNPSTTQDLTNIFFISWNSFSNITTAFGGARQLDLRTDTPDIIYQLDKTDVVIPTTPKLFNYTIPDDQINLDPTLLESGQQIRWLGAGNNYSLYFSDIKLIQPQQLYCQPRQTNERPFSYETKADGSLNEWDFKETTNESLLINNPTDFTISENGYVILVDGSANGLIWPKFSGLSIDTSLYTHVEMNIRTNDSSNSETFRPYKPFTDPLTIFKADGSHNIVITNDWSIQTVILDAAIWTGTFTDIGFTSSALTDGVIFIDYIRLLHTVTPEFKEATNEWWLTSENDSFTYDYALTYDSGTLVDLEHKNKPNVGGFQVNYTSFQDSLFDTECLLPSDQLSDFIQLTSINPQKDVNNFLYQIIGVLPYMFLIIFSILFVVKKIKEVVL